MTTENKDVVGAARSALKAVAEKTRERDANATKALAEAEKTRMRNREILEIAVRVIEHDDDEEVATKKKEADEAAALVTRVNAIDPAQPQPVHVAAEVKTEPVHKSTPESVEVPRTEPVHAQPHPAHAAAKVTPEPVSATPTAVLEPQQEVILSPTTAVSIRKTSTFDPRGWTLLQWVLAIVLGLVGLGIGISTTEWLTGFFANVNWWYWAVVGIQVFFGFAWVIAFTATGFYGGAWLGSAVGNYRTRSHVHSADPVSH